MRRFMLLMVGIVLVVAGCSSQSSSVSSIDLPLLVEPDLTHLAETYNWPKPDRWEKYIVAFEQEGEQPQGAIVAVGSSSMRGWHKNIDEDLEPLTIIKRGFGGSYMNDVLFNADRIILPYNPRAVLLYEGDNDIARGIAPEGVLEAFKALQYKIHSANPEIRIYMMSIKPSMNRWKFWPKMQEANELLKAEAEKDSRITYIDIATPMMIGTSRPRPDIFLNDELHMNRKGYEIWAKTVTEAIMENELEFEEVAE